MASSRLALTGRNIVLGFSGGPDAAALAYRLQAIENANIIPVYISYRQQSVGGKTGKDLRSATPLAKDLGLQDLIVIRAPLGTKPKSHRNRFFIKVLASVAKTYNTDIIALGTMRELPNSQPRGSSQATINDLNPDILSNHGNRHGVRVLTWDSLGINNKADEFRGIDPVIRNAFFKSTSCQMWWKFECGNCYSCVARHEAFMDAFGCDQTLYRAGSKAAKPRSKD